MENKSRFRKLFFFLVIACVMVATIVFVRQATAESDQVIRLTLVNDSQFDFILYIYGKNHKQEYRATVAPYTTDKLFIEPDEYEYYMEVCNYSKLGQFDLWTFQTIHAPVCGGKAEGFTHKAHHIDVSQLIKPVRVTIRNMTGEDVELYLRTQEDHHFLNLVAGEHLQVLLKKEPGIDYVYSFLGCGDQLISGYYTPRQTPPLDLKCP